MRIVFCTKGDRLLPSSRTRAHLVADLLRENGYNAESHHIVTRPWWDLSRARWSDLRKNFALLKSVKKGDVLYLHKMTDQVDFMFMALIRKWIFRRGFIFDFDDAIFLPSVNRAAKAWLMTKNAEAVVVGSHFLQEYSLKHNPRSYVISAPIDTDAVYLPAPARTDATDICIGWTGTPGHYENMKLLVKPLERLVAEGLPITFLQLGGGEKIYELMSSVPGLVVEFIPQVAWDQPKEVIAIIQKFDIGVMPLQKTEQNRGKDAWKAKEYMGCAVATVLSDWGENPYVVTNNVNGMLVTTEDEWYEALKKLVTNASFRKEIGTGGRERMKAAFSNTAFLANLLEVMGVTTKSA